MHDDELLRKAFNTVLRKLTYSSLSEDRIISYLKSKRFDGLIIDLVVEKLKQLEYIDDQKIADRFVRNALERKPKSKALIVRELKAKGIKDQDITDSLSAVSDIDLEVMANLIAAKVRRRYRDKDLDYMKNKVYGTLKLKGFDYSTIIKVLSNIEKYDEE